MKILYSHRIQSHDGQGIHIEAMVTALLDAGHEVLVVGPSFYESGRMGSENRMVGFIRKVLPVWGSELLELGYSVPSWRRLRRAAKEFKPDLIYERYNLFYLAGTWVAKQQRIPYFVEVNAPLADERERHGELRLKSLARWSEYKVWQAANRIFAVTAVLGNIISTSSSVPSENIEITHNGINLDDYPEPLPKPPSTKLRLGFVGFVRDWHGLDDVIDHLAVHNKIPSNIPMELHVVGDGPAIPALKEQAATLGISEDVVFHGLVERDQIPLLVAQFDIALQPKAVSYASPLKVFEYMAAGLPIVAPCQPNICEILCDGENAVLFLPGQPNSMWTAIERLSASPNMRNRIGEAARAKSRSHTWAENAAKVVRAAQNRLS